MFHVRLGVEDDFDAIIDLIGDASAWLQLKGTDQWSRPWPNKKKRDERVRRGLRMGRTWILLDDDVVAATITCHPDGNKWLWKRRERTVRAVYVSRLIVGRNYKGSQIGTELLDWAGKWAKRQYGAGWIRIDVWTTNNALREYYEKRGFEFQRVCKPWRYLLRTYPSGALFQKQTAGLESAYTPRLTEVPAFHRPKEGRRAERPGRDEAARPGSADDRPAIKPSRSPLLAAAAVVMFALYRPGLARRGQVLFSPRAMGSLLRGHLPRARKHLRPDEPGANPWMVAAAGDAEHSAEHQADLPRAFGERHAIF